MLRHCSKRARLLAACFLIQSASFAVADESQPSDAPATIIELTVVGGPALNQNAQGRPSPVLVRIFDLSATQAFQSADYSALFDKPTAALQQDVLAQEEFILRPGDMQEHNRAPRPGLVALGVAAGFRDLAHAKWRIVVQIVPGLRNGLLVELDQERIRLEPIDSHQQ